LNERLRAVGVSLSSGASLVLQLRCQRIERHIEGSKLPERGPDRAHDLVGRSGRIGGGMLDLGGCPHSASMQRDALFQPFDRWPEGLPGLVLPSPAVATIVAEFRTKPEIPLIAQVGTLAAGKTCFGRSIGRSHCATCSPP
jgi:hypothetical protein